jgi:hypothetical protein
MNTHPPILALFEKRIEGDDSLLELGRLRCRQARLGAEMHAGTPEQLEAVMKFRPTADAPVVVHLPRHFNLADGRSQEQILAIASRFAGQVYGLLLHDHPEIATSAPKFVRAARDLNSGLSKLPSRPIIFVEYAAGLEPDVFAGFFESIRDLPGVSAAVDIGHVGLWRARQTFARAHGGQDVCSLKTQPAELAGLMDDVQEAARSALPTVLKLIKSLGEIRKPVHFHLHDGHPLSTFSPFGVSDHLSFFAEIPLRFEYRGRKSVNTMYGPAGLREIACTAVRAIGAERVSLTLEIHPTFEQLPLNDAEGLFRHWTDKTNAEKMNHWLAMLSRNAEIVKECVFGRLQIEDENEDEDDSTA